MPSVRLSRITGFISFLHFICNFIAYCVSSSNSALGEHSYSKKGKTSFILIKKSLVSINTYYWKVKEDKNIWWIKIWCVYKQIYKYNLINVYKVKLVLLKCLIMAKYMFWLEN